MQEPAGIETDPGPERTPERTRKETFMENRRLTRPSLKITRHLDRPGAARFIFEIWNPFVGAYQTVDSVEDGLTRMASLARLIAQMCVRRHPKQSLLIDAPDAGPAGRDRWAEFRVSATAIRSYDTRYDGEIAWARAVGMAEAAATTLAHVGYVRPLPGKP